MLGLLTRLLQLALVTRTLSCGTNKSRKKISNFGTFTTNMMRENWWSDHITPIDNCDSHIQLLGLICSAYRDGRGHLTTVQYPDPHL